MIWDVCHPGTAVHGTSSFAQDHDLAIAIQQRYVAAKDSIALVLEASKKAIPDSIERFCIHEKLMINYLNMHESSTF